MSTEITKKQAILLAVLGVLLVVICYWNFLLKPTLDDISAKNEQIEQLESEYDNLVNQSLTYDANVASLEGWAEKNKAETSKLYPLSQPQRIDNIISRVVSMFDAKITSLSISNLNQYYLDGQGNLIAANPEEVEKSKENTKTANDMENAAYTATGEYCRNFTYSMTGDYEDIVQLINFVNNVSFLGISDLSFSTEESDEVLSSVERFDALTGERITEEISNHIYLGDRCSFNITITAYMFSDPLKKIQGDEEETEEEAAEDTAEEVVSEAAAE